MRTLRHLLGILVWLNLWMTKIPMFTTDVRGTFGHIAPEYWCTRKSSEKTDVYGYSSEKTDVYGYGVMLLELITGRTLSGLASLASNDDGEVMLFDWVKGLLKDKRLKTLLDADMQGQYEEHEVEQLILVALLCTQGSPKQRPKMAELVSMLEGDGEVGGMAERRDVPSPSAFLDDCRLHFESPA